MASKLLLREDAPDLEGPQLFQRRDDVLGRDARGGHGGKGALQPLLEVLRRHLARGGIRAQPHRVARDAAAAGAGRPGHRGDGLAGWGLQGPAHVAADHAHAGALVHDLLQLPGQ